MTDQIIIEVPKVEWLSANDRMRDWTPRAYRTKKLRERGYWTAKQAHLGHHQVVHVAAWIQYPRGGRADPANAAPTVKALVDGLVDAGMLPDDDSTHLVGPDFRREPGCSPKGTHRIRLVITPQEVPF